MSEYVHTCLLCKKPMATGDICKECSLARRNDPVYRVALKRGGGMKLVPNAAMREVLKKSKAQGS